MTIEQITAINNSISMLADLAEYANIGANSMEEFDEYINRHIKDMKDSNVDRLIVEHLESLCYSYREVARDAVARHWS